MDGLPEASLEIWVYIFVAQGQEYTGRKREADVEAAVFLKMMGHCYSIVAIIYFVSIDLRLKDITLQLEQFVVLQECCEI